MHEISCTNNILSIVNFINVECRIQYSPSANKQRQISKYLQQNSTDITSSIVISYSLIEQIYHNTKVYRPIG